MGRANRHPSFWGYGGSLRAWPLAQVYENIPGQHTPSQCELCVDSLQLGPVLLRLQAPVR